MGVTACTGPLGVSEFVRKLTERLTLLSPINLTLNSLFTWLCSAGFGVSLLNTYCARMMLGVILRLRRAILSWIWRIWLGGVGGSCGLQVPNFVVGLVTRLRLLVVSVVDVLRLLERRVTLVGLLPISMANITFTRWRLVIEY